MMGKKKADADTRTLSGRKARRELRRARRLSRRGPIAPYRMAAAVVASLVVAGPAMVRAAGSGDLADPLLRFVCAAALTWMTWGLVDSVFADVQHREEREAELARRVAARARKRERAEAEALKAQMQLPNDVQRS